MTNCFRVDVPGVDSADHVLSQEIRGHVARPCSFRQEQDNQSPHLKIVPAVIDEAPTMQTLLSINLYTHSHVVHIERLK